MRLLLFCIILASSPAAHAWSEGPHRAITRAAVAALPQWERDLLGPEAKGLEDHCLIPDQVYTDKANAKFAAMETQPGVIYIQSLHLPLQQEENLKTLHYFISKVVLSLQAKQSGDAARYMGTLCHIMEDFGSPSHTVPGDNMFTLIQQFIPPTERMAGQLLHSPVEIGEWEVDLAGYQPRQLGSTVDEAAWRLLHRVHEGIINARSTTVPIIQALYAGEPEQVKTQQLRAATLDARIVADALHTCLCLGAQRLEPQPAADIASYWPLEAESLYWPQKQFFSQPHWGHPQVNACLADGRTSHPLSLLRDGAPYTPSSGISVGIGKPVSYLLPKGSFRRFTVSVGLHAELGKTGRVEFRLLVDDKLSKSVILNGTDSAEAWDCNITGASRIQLSCENRGLQGKAAYAIWAEPRLHH
jgi:hypothetical protein